MKNQYAIRSKDGFLLAGSVGSEGLLTFDSLETAAPIAKACARFGKTEYYVVKLVDVAVYMAPWTEDAEEGVVGD